MSNSVNFDNIRNDLQALAKNLPSDVRARAALTIEDYAAIAKQLSALQALGPDRQKIAAEVNKLTAEHGGGGLEDLPSLAVLSERIALFSKTYLAAKQKGELIPFFSSFSKGGPCLSARMDSLSSYAAELELGLKVKEMVDPEKALFLISSCLADQLIGFMKENPEMNPENLQSNQCKEQFAEYVQTHLDEAVAYLNRYEGSPHERDLLAFLEMEGLYRPGTPVNWNTLLQATIRSPAFSNIYRFSILTAGYE